MEVLTLSGFCSTRFRELRLSIASGLDCLKLMVATRAPLARLRRGGVPVGGTTHLGLSITVWPGCRHQDVL